MGSITVVLGAQWGDEGKGKWIDRLAGEADLIARFQGGSNAGHTLYVSGRKLVLHQLPSGICHPDKISALLAGVVVDPVALLREQAEVAEQVSISPRNLWISAAAHVISPWHIAEDCRLEAERAEPIGTTKRGIGPAYSSKYNRTGLRMGDYIDPQRFALWCGMMRAASPAFSAMLARADASWEEFVGAAELIRPYVVAVESRIRQRLAAGAQLLMEGAQGSLLDIDHGTYPYVTSSSTLAANAAVSLGIDPRKLSRIFGVGKAYVTRVGGGSFPSEMHDSLGDLLVEKGAEYGATTKRRRRCGWFDAVAMAYAATINGFDGLYLNKVDILSGFSLLKVVVAYRYPDGTISREFPSSHDVLARCQPLYAEYPGWDEDISRIVCKEDLPLGARNYLQGLAEHSGVPLIMVGTGPGGDDCLSW